MAEGVELSYEVGGPSVDVDLPVVEVPSQVDEAGARIGEQMPDHDEDRTCYRYESTLASSSTQEPTVALPQEGVSPRRGGCDLSQDALEIGVNGHLFIPGYGHINSSRAASFLARARPRFLLAREHGFSRHYCDLSQW